MGNVHGIRQLEPVTAQRGAAIRITGDVDRVRRLFANLSSADVVQHGCSLFVHARNFGASWCVDPRVAFLLTHGHGKRSEWDWDEAFETIDETNWYREPHAAFLLIHDGGKRGYGDDWDAAFEQAAPELSDAVFLQDDEYAGFVDEVRIAKGLWSRTRLVESASSILEYLESELEGDELADLLLREGELLSSYGPQVGQELLARAFVLKATERGALLLARAYADAGRHQDALNMLKRAIELHGPASEHEVELRNAHALFFRDVYWQMARAYKALGQIDDALLFAEEAAQLVAGLDSTALFLLCELQLMRDDLEGAHGTLEDADKLSQTRQAVASLNYLRACVLARQGDVDDAFFRLRVACELMPDLVVQAKADVNLKRLRDQAARFLNAIGDKR